MKSDWIRSNTFNHKEFTESYVADIFEAKDILQHLPAFTDKGENLRKALYISKGDIIVHHNADIKNIYHRFVCGLLGPLLARERLKYL